MANIITEPALLRLLQLGSSGLPVGGFAYSQGLEYAVDSGQVRNCAECESWLMLQIEHSLMRIDLAILFRIYQAIDRKDTATMNYWNQYLLACRETRELRMADTAMGQALQQLMRSTGMSPAVVDECSYVTAFCQAASQWQIAARSCALVFCWSWLEGQVTAATKLVPLGQTQAQLLLGSLQQQLPKTIDAAQSLEDGELGAGLPALALASTLHETQYSRMFRS